MSSVFPGYSWKSDIKISVTVLSNILFYSFFSSSGIPMTCILHVLELLQVREHFVLGKRNCYKQAFSHVLVRCVCGVGRCAFCSL